MPKESTVASQPSCFSSKGPLVTVIINCYNGELYLKEALQSVCEQTYINWEIVFWDNASTDSSASIAKDVGTKLRYFRSVENMPLGAARNKALDQARGDYVVFLDCDDLLLSNAIEIQVSALESSRCALAYAGSIIINGEGRELKRRVPKSRSGHLLGDLLRQYEIGLPAVMIRREALTESGLGFDPALHMAEDYCLFMQIAATYNVDALPQIIAKYRIHVNALTVKTIARWGSEVDYTLDLLISRNPALLVQYKTAFRIARARAAYYRARYHVVKRERVGAMVSLAPYLFCDYRYPFLFVILFLPLPVWDYVHEWHSGRSFR